MYMQIGREKNRDMLVTEENYVDIAENVIMQLKKEKQKNGKELGLLTMSQIRNMLSMCADIYNQIVSQTNTRDNDLNDEIRERINYLKIRFVYEAGRDKKVNAFVKNAYILENLKEIRGSKQKFLLFHQYMEALVAFHRFYGGQE